MRNCATQSDVELFPAKHWSLPRCLVFFGLRYLTEVPESHLFRQSTLYVRRRSVRCSSSSSPFLVHLKRAHEGLTFARRAFSTRLTLPNGCTGTASSVNTSVSRDDLAQSQRRDLRVSARFVKDSLEIRARPVDCAAAAAPRNGMRSVVLG